MHQKIRWALFSLLALFSTSTTLLANQQIVQTVLDGATITQFVEPLPQFNGVRVDGTKDLKITTREVQQRVLPAAFYKGLASSVTYVDASTGDPVATINPKKGTYVFGYEVKAGDTVSGPLFPAFTIVAKQNIPTKAKYVNGLGPFTDLNNRTLSGPLLQKFITPDMSYHWANPLMENNTNPGPFGPQGSTSFYEGPQPVVTHLHGGMVPSAFDGSPTSWFTPGNILTGPGFVTNEYVYPNTQEATTLWFHDHVLGMTRTNIYAGLAGFYFLRGEPDSAVKPPLPGGDFEIEILIQDRQFDTNGQWYWPDGDPSNAGLNGDPANPYVHPYGIPEFFGDVIVVNGKSWPYLKVEPRRYRFRFLDGSNARFYSMYLKNMASGGTVPDIWQIGTDGGLLNKPVNLSSFVPFTWNPSNEAPPPYGSPAITSPRFFIAPGERADVIIDFTGREGETFLLANDAPAPYPDGDTNPTAAANIMQFRVTKPLSSKDRSFDPAKPGATLRTGSNEIVKLANGNGGLADNVVIDQTRQLVLIEQEGPQGPGGSSGPVVVLVNNTHWDGLNPNTMLPIPDSVPYNFGNVHVTEIPQVGSTELWEVINMTPDAHPMHIHLIEFQIMNRQVYNVGNVVPPFTISPSYRSSYESAWGPDGTMYGAGSPALYLSTPALGGNPDPRPFLVGSVIKPDPNETGWKDVVKMFPGTVTRLLVRLAPEQVPVKRVCPGENKFPFDPTATLGVLEDGFGYPGGPGYVWHCHIVDHEDNDMMRPMMISNRPQRD